MYCKDKLNRKFRGGMELKLKLLVLAIMPKFLAEENFELCFCSEAYMLLELLN
jgi:hypothetical protein